MTDKISEQFYGLRTRLGLTQEALAERLGLKLRAYQKYEGGDYDSSEAPQVRQTILRFEKLRDTVNQIPTQKGDNESILNNLTALRNEVKAITDGLLKTIESQARTIEALTKKG